MDIIKANKKLLGGRILVINGPNLNLLGVREPDTYGNMSLMQINQELESLAHEFGVQLACYQSNIEGEIVTKIGQQVAGAHDRADFILINAGAYTHTSIAIADALMAVNVPFIEIHISNVFKREEYRHKSYLSNIAVGTIGGLGHYGYTMGLLYAVQYLS